LGGYFKVQRTVTNFIISVRCTFVNSATPSSLQIFRSYAALFKKTLRKSIAAAQA
jgi:hypothetical protein